MDPQEATVCSTLLGRDLFEESSQPPKYCFRNSAVIFRKEGKRNSKLHPFNLRHNCNLNIIFLILIIYNLNLQIYNNLPLLITM